MAVAQLSSGGVAVHFALLVLWMMSCLHIAASSRRCEKSYTQRGAGA